MSSCTFFGHRECPDSIKAQLRAALIDLVTNHDADMFYVGNQGQFDAIVRSVLREMKKEYPQINYTVVLAYMPGKQTIPLSVTQNMCLNIRISGKYWT